MPCGFIVEGDWEKEDRGRSGGAETLVLRLHNTDRCRPQSGGREERREERRGEERYILK